MNVYHILPDSDNFGCIGLKSGSILYPTKGNWMEFMDMVDQGVVEFEHSLYRVDGIEDEEGAPNALARGDIFYTIGTIMAFSPRAFTTIAHTFEQEFRFSSCEVLGKYRLAMPIILCDCIEESQSPRRYIKGVEKPLDYINIAIHSDRIRGDVFMIEGCLTKTFCTEAFRQFVLDKDLSGIDFRSGFITNVLSDGEGDMPHSMYHRLH